MCFSPKTNPLLNILSNPLKNMQNIMSWWTKNVVPHFHRLLFSFKFMKLKYWRRQALPPTNSKTKQIEGAALYNPRRQPRLPAPHQHHYVILCEFSLPLVLVWFNLFLLATSQSCLWPILWKFNFISFVYSAT